MSLASIRATTRTALVAGIAYTAAWLAGLTVAAAGTDVSSSGAEVVAALTGHEAAAALQYLLTEVVAAAALAVTVAGVARSAAARAAARGDTAAGRAAGALRTAAFVAAGLSAVQGVLGLVVALVAVPDADAGTAGALTEAVNRTDGVKMFVLAAMALLGLRAGRGGGLPRWLAPVAAALAVTVAASGVGYLLLVPSFALAAYASLPLLLVWVTGAGVAAGLRPRADR